MSEDDIIDIVERIADFGWSDYDDFLTNKKAVQSILDLYNKQKETIKELEEEIKELELCLKAEEKYSESLNRDIQALLHFEEFSDHFISKDKIKAKIEELEKMEDNQYIHISYIRKILQELMENE